MQHFQPKHSLLAVFLFLLVFKVSAQKDIPSFGSIEPEDLKMTVCDFDADAPALILFHTGELMYGRGSDGDFNIQTRYRVRIKILKENGIEQANIKLRYYAKNNYESILKLKGITFNLNEKGQIETTKLDEKNIYSQVLDDRYSAKVFSMPAVKVGSVIEYEYTKYRESSSSLEAWYFQDHIPTRLSRYDITIPQYFEFTSQTNQLDPIEVKEDEKSETMTIGTSLLTYRSKEKIYTMRNLPGIREEAYMTAVSDYLQKIQFQIQAFNYGNQRVEQITTWDKLIKSLKEGDDFFEQLKKNLPNTDDLEVQLMALHNDFDKMNAIYNYVRKNMIHNGYETFWSSNGIKQAWGKHEGTSGDINLILINLLKKAGLDVNPMLVSSRDHGYVNIAYPFLNQFNNVLAVVTCNEKVYYLDASDRYNPARLIPYDYINTLGFLIKDWAGNWTSIVSPSDKFKQLVAVNGTISEKGILKGTASVNSSDYAKNPRVSKWQNKKENFSEYFYSTSYPTLKIDSLKVENDKNDSLPLVQNFEFETALNSTGEYMYFNTNLFLGFEKNPFTSEKRFTNIDFGYKQNYLLYGNFDIPEGYVLEELPKNIRMITVDTSISITRMYSYADNQLSMRIEIEFLRDYYSKNEYPDLKEFYKKLYAILNEQIVIRKK